VPTSKADPGRAKRQRRLHPPQDAFQQESDWLGLLLGLAFAIGGVGLVILAIHVWLRVFGT
jgi:hypothetical protein